MAEQMVLLRELDRFARECPTDYPVSDALHDLIETATVALDIDGAGLSLARDDRLVLAAAVPARVALVEEAQQRDRRGGPSVRAYRSGEPVLVPDLRATGDRWPRLAALADAAGVLAVASVPLQLDGAHLGALTLYCSRVHRWSDDEARAARLLAALASGCVVNASHLEHVRDTAGQLQVALDSRVVIEQAKGVLAGERGITVDEAFRLLRSHARATRSPLRVIAHAVVSQGLRP